MKQTEFLRQSSCNQCLYGRSVDVKYSKSFCEKTKREGYASRACYCEQFERRLKQSNNETSENGFKYRSKQIEDYRTANQWAEAGFKVKSSAKGYEMHPTVLSKKTFIYYLPEDVEEINSSDRVCATCAIRTGRFCIIMGEHIRMYEHCSEWKGERNEK